MMIDGNQKEKDAMRQFHCGNSEEGHRLQDEFIAEFQAAYADRDHCPCQTACKLHGKCRECIAVHRAHMEHVPVCLQPMLNRRIRALSELTEHTFVNEIEAPGDG